MENSAEKRQKYSFAHYTNTDFLYNANNNLIPRKKILTYAGVDLYQICLFHNPRSKLHDVKRFAVTANNEIANVRHYRLTEDQIKKLQSKLKHNQYKCYATYDLDNVPDPDINSILLAQSSFLDSSSNYTGQLMFDNF